MKHILFFAIAFLIFKSCASVKAGNVTLNENVPFNQAKNYFVRNNAEAAIGNPKFETQQDFDQVFGMATTMGDNGKPTSIDFSKEFVVAQIENPSFQSVFLEPISIRKNGKILEITFRKVMGKTLSYSAQTSMILIIDRKYEGDVNFVEVR